MSGVSKLRFKGDKPKKKKRSHREHAGAGDDLEAMANADPNGWMFPTDALEVSGPAYILLPTEPLTCLAWDATRQKVYAAPVEPPQVAEGANDLSPNELLQATEPTDVHHVWVVSRLAGSEEISLRTSSGTFLTASPSGALSATTPSRGPLEGYTVSVTAPSSSSSSSASSLFPTVTIKTSSAKYISVPRADADVVAARKAELRADAEAAGEREGLRIKCQREFVLKARVAALEGEGVGGKRRLLDRGPKMGSYEDEMRRSSEAQAWGGGRHHVSSDDRRALRKAAKEVGMAEAMLDRRAKMKSDKYTK